MLKGCIFCDLILSTKVLKLQAQKIETFFRAIKSSLVLESSPIIGSLFCCVIRDPSESKDSAQGGDLRMRGSLSISDWN